jgi:hypothetical protein
MKNKQKVSKKKEKTPISSTAKLETPSSKADHRRKASKTPIKIKGHLSPRHFLRSHVREE